MIIKGILIFGLLLSLLYALSQRQKSRLVSSTISLVALGGMYLVLNPERTSDLARLIGVGRGADLIVYCWLVISLIVSINLQFKILDLQGMITELTREIALQSARRPPDGHD